MTTYLGDFAAGATVRVWWNTTAIAGESITRATNGTVSVYKDGSATQTTTGVTDNEDVDSLTGVHRADIDTSADGTFYAAGSEFAVVLSAATVDGKTINHVLGQFSIQNRYVATPLSAAQTAAAVLDATAADYNDANSIGAKINAAGAAADPLENDPTTYAAGTVGAKIAQIGTVGATIPSPANPSGELTLNQGVSYTTYSSLVYNCRLVGGFDENTHPVKLFVDYGDGTVLIKTVAVTSIATTASYITVDLAPALTSVVTRNMPVGRFQAQIVLFNGSGNSEANIIYELTLNVETPGFNYSASDT